MDDRMKMEIEKANEYKQKLLDQINDLETMDTQYKPVVTAKDFKHNFLKDIADKAYARKLTVYPSVIDELIERELAERFTKVVKECIGISLSTEDLFKARKELSIYDLKRTVEKIESDIQEAQKHVFGLGVADEPKEENIPDLTLVRKQVLEDSAVSEKTESKEEQKEISDSDTSASEATEPLASEQSSESAPWEN